MVLAILLLTSLAQAQDTPCGTPDCPLVDDLGTAMAGPAGESFLDTLDAPVRNNDPDMEWRYYNNSPYHCPGCGYGSLDDSYARDYSLSVSRAAAGQGVYSLADGGVVVANVTVTYKAFACSNCAEVNHMVIVRYDNPAWQEGGDEPHYYYAEYMHIAADVSVGDIVDADEPFATIQTEGPKDAAGVEQMSPHLHFSLFSSDDADVFTDRVPYGAADTTWEIDQLTPVDMDITPDPWQDPTTLVTEDDPTGDGETTADGTADGTSDGAVGADGGAVSVEDGGTSDGGGLSAGDGGASEAADAGDAGDAGGAQDSPDSLWSRFMDFWRSLFS